MFQNTKYDPSQTVEKAVAVVQEIERQEQERGYEPRRPEDDAENNGRGS
jgi:hypothetical protein